MLPTREAKIHHKWEELKYLLWMSPTSLVRSLTEGFSWPLANIHSKLQFGSISFSLKFVKDLSEVTQIFKLCYLQGPKIFFVYDGSSYCQLFHQKIYKWLIRILKNKMIRIDQMSGILHLKASLIFITYILFDPYMI